jgi:hypothetical protein
MLYSLPEDINVANLKIEQRVETINMTSLFTTGMQRLSRKNQTCMIFTADPIKWAIDVYKQNFGSDVFGQINVKNVINGYLKKKKSYDEELKKLTDENKENTNMSRKSNKAKDSLKNLEAIQRLQNFKPYWEFPQQYQLCSEAHLNRYGIVNNGSFGIISQEDLPEISVVSDEIITLLASGIGVYSTKCDLDDDYLASVLTLSKRGLLKFIIADSSLAYGTNLSVTDLIIDDRVTDRASEDRAIDDKGLINTSSVKSFLQMMGRAGRSELSCAANIYTLDNNLVKKLDQYINGTLDEGERDEVQNINAAFDLLC